MKYGMVGWLAAILVAMLPWGLRGQDSDEPKDQTPGLNSALVSSLAFRAIGPALMSGRVGDIAIDPIDRSTWYVAASSGGVWKTVNAGVTWQPIFDGYNSYSIGCVATDPQDRFTIWVGTGENNSQRSVGYGDGLYKSIDGGQSFTRVGLENSEHIGRIVVHPKDGNIVYVAAQGPLWKSGGDRGLYKTTDGGKTWNRILHISEETGINEVHLDPSNPEILYASAYQRRRHTWTLIDGGPESGLHKSIDGGATWKALNRGLPGGDKGRIGLAISPLNPEIVYAIVEAADGQSGFYRSANRGENWEKQSGYLSSSPQYYQEIVACPHKFDRIYSLDTLLMVSEDGGKNFAPLGEADKHVDNHALIIDPADERHLIVGCDGGVYETWDRGKTYDFKANLPITQFYKIGLSREKPFYYVYGGTQDNATQGAPTRTVNRHGIRNSDWFITTFGDGFDSAVDPNDPDTIYSQSQYGGLVRYNRKTGEEIDIQPQADKGGPPLRFNWDSALLISPHNSKRLYFAAQLLFRSDDRGDSWTAVSPDLTRQIDRNKLKVMGRIWGLDAVAKNASTSFYGNITAVDESPLVQGLLYAGTDDGLVQISEDGGQNWTKVESFKNLDVPEFAYVSDIKASLHDSNTVYVCVNNHQRGDFRPFVVKSVDRGKTWVSIRGDLPERGSSYTIEQDHVNPKLLFVGTEFGCFCTLDEGEKWLQLKGGLPPIAIRDIEIQREENDVVLGSFGRGIFVLDNYSPLRELSQGLIDQPAKLFPVKKGEMFIQSAPLAGGGSRAFQGANFYTAPNPAYGVTFTVYLKESLKTKRQVRKENEAKLARAKQDTPYPAWDDLRAEEAEDPPRILLTIRDANNQVVNSLDASPSSGVQRLTWDYRYPAIGSSRGRGGVGPLALPGKYTVAVTQLAGGETKELVAPTEFEIEPLAWASLEQPNRQAILEFCRQAARLQNAVIAANQIMSEVDERLSTVQQTIKSHPQLDRGLAEEARQLQLRLTKIRQRFDGDALVGRYNEPVYPGLNSRLQGMVLASFSASTGPTGTHRKLYDIASQEFDEAVVELRQLVDADLAGLHQKLDAAQAPWTPGRKIPDWK
jgi:photosystem II stability/assembly factor-like uncharacterized protein